MLFMLLMKNYSNWNIFRTFCDFTNSNLKSLVLSELFSDVGWSPFIMFILQPHLYEFMQFWQLFFPEKTYFALYINPL